MQGVERCCLSRSARVRGTFITLNWSAGRYCFSFYYHQMLWLRVAESQTRFKLKGATKIVRPTVEREFQMLSSYTFSVHYSDVMSSECVRNECVRVQCSEHSIKPFENTQ